MLSKVKQLLSQIPKWVFRVILILIGLLIFIFNDFFGSSEIFGIAAFLYFLIVIGLIARWFFKQTKAIINLKNEKTKTELMHLQSQVNPHFFFNMLNNLYGLVEKDSKKAQELILKLSDMMRYSIYNGQKDTVAINEEVAYLKNYIALHKMRYHKKIDVLFTLHVQDETFKIMPLLFIILLENAFKHGVENLREHAYVHINMTVTENTVHFDIENNFEPTEETTSPGIGLKNLKRRLELVYPKNHSLSFTQTKEIYKALLTIEKS
ncbi:MAG: histidine kinase [Flavobacteriaceae bacterium]|nr:MAG: histidine kinase [Flavobacteriaceae bacterium]